MFNFLKSGDRETKAIDKVWTTTEAKLNACVEMFRADNTCLFVAWFEETRQMLEKRLKSDGNSPCLASELTPDRIAGHRPVFIEHHPSRKKEESLFAMLKLPEVPVLSALDEPLMMHFGGERIAALIKQLGMKESEAIGNSMVAKSMRNAQKKIDESVQVEKPAASAAEWFRLNLPKK